MNRENRSQAKKMLAELQLLMQNLLEKVKVFCEKESDTLEARFLENTNSPSPMELESHIFTQFIYQLFYKKTMPARHVSFSIAHHKILQDLLNQHEDFSFRLHVAFFDGEKSLHKAVRNFNNLSQNNLPRLKILIQHLKTHRDFYISSRNRSVFLEFLKAIKNEELFKETRQSRDVLKEMGEFSADLLTQFANLETVDIYWSRRSLSENPYACFIELLQSKPAEYDQYMPHFLLLNPHIANFLSAQIDKMEQFAGLWLQYKNSRKISHGQDMEIMVNGVIEHVFKNRDFYLLLASGKLDDLAEEHPLKYGELKNCIIDLVEDLSLEQEKIKIVDENTSDIYSFLIQSLLHKKIHKASGQLFTTSQANLFKDFLYKHLHLVEILYRHFCWVSEEEEEDDLSQIDGLIMEARYLNIDNEEIFAKFVNHMNENRKFYQTFLEELISFGSQSLLDFFKDKTVFSQVAKLFSAPEVFDSENNGFKAESPRRSLLDMLRKNENYDVSQNITDFLLCNPSLANFFCQNYELFADAVAKYAATALKRKPKFEGGSFWKKQAIDDKPTTGQRAQTAVNDFWDRNQTKISKQESKEECKSASPAVPSLENLLDAIPQFLG
jgi:hypothetical protein